jgi:hypothetical protein
MTKGLLVSRKCKLELQKLSILNPASFSNTFKQYRNLFNSTLCASKNLYYDNKFSLYAKNPKKTWETLNELTSSTLNPSKKNIIPNLVTLTGNISNPNEIAEEFNSFFCKGWARHI